MVQHSGWGSWEARNDWAGLRVLRRIPSALSRHYYDNRAITTPTTTRMATQASASRLRASARSRALDGCARVTTPPPERRTPSPRRSCDAHLSHRRASPCRPGERTRPPRGSPRTTSLGRGLSSYPHTKRNRRPARGPGGVRVAKCLPVNRDTRNVPPTTTCAVPPNEGSRRQKNAAQLEGPGRRKLSIHPHSSSTTERCNVAAVAHQGRRTY